MASLSILSYNLTQGLKMKSNENSSSSSSLASGNNNNSLAKTFNKITVQNVLSECKGNVLNISNNNGSANSSSINNANAIVKKIKDFGMIGAVNAVSSGSNSIHTSTITATKVGGVARKRPLSESKNSNSSSIRPAITAATPKKPKLSVKAATTPKSSAKKSCENVNQQKLTTQVGATVSSSKSTAPTAATPTLTAGTPGRKGLPAPQAVARRNARERNRVKQVNNGFAALRERIPEEVAEAFEAQGNGRAAAASKKLSKVETLRMAVEYIRSLERLLGFDFPIGATPTADDSFALIKDEFGALSPGLDDQYNDDSLSNYELDEDFAASHPPIVNNSVDDTPFDEQSLSSANVLDLLPNITTLNGLQYIRIPGTSTYQLLTADIFAGNSQSPTTSTYIEDEQFNALIDTNCQSPRSASSSVTTTADDDLHGSPTATAATPTLIMQTTTAPALHQAATNGDHVRRTTSSSSSSSSSLSRSPVPQTSSSPNVATSMLQQQQQRQDLPTTTTAPETLSPVGDDELLLQTCADDVVLTMGNNERLSIAGHQQFVAPMLAQQQQEQQQRQQDQQSLLPSHKIKQEFNETIFDASAELTTNLSAAFIYQTIMHHNQQQQQQQQLLLEQTSMSMSPPLDRVNSSSTEVILTTSSALPGYFEQDHNGSFYDGIVTFKKERNVQDNTSSNTTAVLSDESMMEAIDWWEAHTPKSDGGSVIM